MQASTKYIALAAARHYTGSRGDFSCGLALEECWSGGMMTFAWT